MRTSSDPASDRVFLFGIRHHGPGSARSLRAALQDLCPDLLLVEGPPEANPVLPLAVHEAMRPPVALLIYAAKEPGLAAYYPFAEYSPEWQAIRFGIQNRLPVRMIDLPQSIQMAWSRRMEDEAPRRMEPTADAAQASIDIDEGPEHPGVEVAPSSTPPPVVFDPADPLKLLAEAAGYSESEQFWERLVEQHRGAAVASANGLFAGILEAMTALRESAPPETHPIAIRREAAMRQNLRLALEEGYQRIAVVCGAWHTPALLDLSHPREDAALLKGLPKMEVRATWIPWTNARLTRQSGYGAGVDSPGWYQHLWATDEQVTSRWMIRVARLLREEDLDISPAHVIEAVRLAEALAALRGHPLPGLAELNEAALTVFCMGNAAPMRLIEDRLLIGDTLGIVPEETPMAPLQQDFDKEARRLKLTPDTTEKLIDLDLRKPLDLQRSHLLHRLALLEIPWGSASDAALRATAHGRSGTFHEIWRLKWAPEFTVLLIEAGQWGNTIESAATARIYETARQAEHLETLSGLVEDVLLAELPDAIQPVMDSLQTRAALSTDLRLLMQALPSLASVLRYGNVRNTDVAMLDNVVEGIAARICIGLPGACNALNDEAAAEMFDQILKVDEALNRLDQPELLLAWQKALLQLLNNPGISGLLAGRACRILMDASALPLDEATRRFGLALSPASEPLWAAAWAEGFLRGSGQFLIHDEKLLGLLDRWMCDLPGETFSQLLPLLRRTFATFTSPERRNIGEQIHHAGQNGAAQPASLSTFDSNRADAVLPLVARLLGLPAAGEKEETNE
jgi:hypothetical protein